MITERRIRQARLGDATTQMVAGGAGIAGAGLATVQAAASAGLITLGTTAAAAIPVAGAVIAVGTLIYGLLHDSRAGQQKLETTAAVNKAEQFMQQNLAAWNASDKSNANQAQALQNFDAAWQSIVNFCSQASEGNAGKRCISERQRGSQYDYFAAYRDPIANDPAAGRVDAAAAAQASASNAPAFLTTAGTPAAGGNLAYLLIPAAIITAAMVSK
jgi:hypothetical protein